MTSDPTTDVQNLAATKRGRLDFLDAVRGFASLLVVVHHTLESLSSDYTKWSHNHVDLGRVGITAFFLVSGYVVGLTLSKQTPRTFVVRRFWRLYPIYWLSTLVWVAVWYATGHSVNWDLGVLTVGANVLMVQGFVGLYSILGPAWTLGVEIAFYGQSVLAKIARVFRWYAWAGMLWLAIFAVLALSNLFRHTTYSAVIPLMMFTASLGLSVYRWDQHRERAVFVLAGSAIVLVPLLGVALGETAGRPGVWPPIGFDASYLVGLALFALLYILRTKAAARWILWLGAISYSLYLIHVSVIQLVGTTPLWKVGGVTAVIAVMIVSIAAASLLHKFVEKPSTEVGRRLT